MLNNFIINESNNKKLKLIKLEINLNYENDLISYLIIETYVTELLLKKKKTEIIKLGIIWKGEWSNLVNEWNPESTICWITLTSKNDIKFIINELTKFSEKYNEPKNNEELIIVKFSLKILIIKFKEDKSNWKRISSENWVKKK